MIHPSDRVLRKAFKDIAPIQSRSPPLSIPVYLSGGIQSFWKLELLFLLCIFASKEGDIAQPGRLLLHTHKGLGLIPRIHILKARHSGACL